MSEIFYIIDNYPQGTKNFTNTTNCDYLIFNDDVANHIKEISLPILEATTWLDTLIHKFVVYTIVNYIAFIINLRLPILQTTKLFNPNPNLTLKILTTVAEISFTSLYFYQYDNIHKKQKSAKFLIYSTGIYLLVWNILKRLKITNN